MRRAPQSIRNLLGPILLLAVLLAPLAAAALAENAPNEALDRALEAYGAALEESDRNARLAGFAHAERSFLQLIAAGAQNAALQTNLGNAALQAEDRGRAVLAYRRALELDANFPRALQNLEHVRTLLPTWVPRPEPAGAFDSFFFYQALPRADRALAGGVAFAIGGLLIGLSIRFRQGALRGAGAVALVAWALLVGSTVLEDSDGARGAVVVADEVLARSADSALAPLAFPEPLPGGTEVTLVEHRSPWARIRLANGRDAWVNESSVDRVAPLPSSSAPTP